MPKLHSRLPTDAATLEKSGGWGGGWLFLLSLVREEDPRGLRFKSGSQHAHRLFYFFPHRQHFDNRITEGGGGVAFDW